MRWIDGRPIKRKVVDIGGVYANNEARVAHGITDMYRPLRAYGFAASPGGPVAMPSIYANPDTQRAYGIGLAVTSTQVQVYTGTEMPLTAPVHVVVEYVGTA